MKFNRTVFWRTLAIFAILDACVLLSGCSDWETQAINVIGLLRPAIVALIQILAAFGVGISPTVLAAFDEYSKKADDLLTSVKALILQYKTAEATAQPGILNEIQALLSTVSSDLSTLLPEVNITNATTQAKIMAGFSAAQGFIAAIIALIPAVKPTLTVAEAHELSGKLKTSVNDFKTQFNDAVSYFGKQYEI